MARRHSPQSSQPVKFLDIFISGYILGYIFFFTTAEFGISAFDNVFYVWNNMFYGSIGAFVSLYYIGGMDVKRKVKYPLLFSLVMYVWELLVLITGWDVNNPWAVMVCFLALVGVISYYAFKEFKKISKYL